MKRSATVVLKQYCGAITIKNIWEHRCHFVCFRKSPTDSVYQTKTGWKIMD